MKRTGNLDGLDLELSQSTRNFDLVLNKLRGNKEATEQAPGLIKKNQLLDSLDLNVGMGALVKLQDVWAKKKKVNFAANANKKDVVADVIKKAEGRAWTKADFEQLDAAQAEKAT